MDSGSGVVLLYCFVFSFVVFVLLLFVRHSMEAFVVRCLLLFVVAVGGSFDLQKKVGEEEVVRAEPNCGAFQKLHSLVRTKPNFCIRQQRGA
jgi:hypothetical protein